MPWLLTAIRDGAYIAIIGTHDKRVLTRETTYSSVHSRALGNLVDDLFVLALRKADDVHGVGRIA